jgi:prepilin signal peptidase PulO-like enzyme (type II secretory pathway)
MNQKLSHSKFLIATAFFINLLESECEWGRAIWVFIVDIFVFIFGLIFGSFFNVVAIRLLKGESIAFPPSHCPSCKQPLHPLDLIPVVSYLFLRGKCRYCNKRISSLYPFGELMTALSFYVVYKHIGISLELIPGSILVSVLVLAVMTDLRQKLILDRVTLPVVVMLLIMRMFVGEYSFWFYVIGGMVGFALLLVIAIISKGGMGGGDIKLYAAIGLALGPWLTMMSLVLASFIGAFVGLTLILLGRVQRRDFIPFAPFIWLGTLVAYLYGQELWTWYMNIW